MPYALLIGMSASEFWQSNPHTMKPYTKSYMLRKEQNDNGMWIMGQYILSAVSVSLEHCLSGKKARSKYLEQPILKDYFQNQDLTQEERDRKELEKMLSAERQWQARYKTQGLPETVKGK